MIITRQNYKQAYLVFAANGTIRLNKKTIGLWTMERPRRGFLSGSEYPLQFKAKVHYNRNSMVTLTDGNKLQLMRTVAKNIPDAMLTKLDNSQNC